MSTRANIIIQDRWSTLYFYRHCDGYPSGVEDTLKKFLQCVIDDKLRDNAVQSAGWLILLGAAEDGVNLPNNTIGGVEFSPEDWQCGAYEPTTTLHGDIEYLYIVDLEAKEIRCCEPPSDHKYDRGRPPDPFYVVTAENINQPIQEP